MFMQGAALSAQHVRYALDAGEPAHAARALAYEAMLRTTRRPQDDHAPLFARARELAQEAGDPAVIAAVEVRHGVACLACDDYEAGRDSLLRGHEILVHQCPGQPWLLTNTRMQLGVSCYILIEHAELAAYVDAWVSDAKQREDLYAYAALAGYGFGFFRYLMRDDPQGALAELAEAMAPWRHAHFSTNHFGEVLGNAHALAYSGGDASLRWFEENRARLDRAVILRSPVFKFTVCNLRITACLSAAEGVRPDRMRALLSEIEAQVSVLRRMGSPLSLGFATLWSSALKAVAGNAEGALVEAREAQRVLARRHKTYGMLARFWEGWLEGGQSGQEKCARVIATLRENGWRTPMRYVHMLAPMTRLVRQAS
jgi:hypothetical protein